MGPKDLDIGGKDLFFDRKDVAGLVDDLWDRVDLLEGDREIFPGIHCVEYPNSHTPGSQCVYVETEDGMVSIVGDMVRKVELNVGRLIPPGLFYDLEAGVLAPLPRVGDLPAVQLRVVDVGEADADRLVVLDRLLERRVQQIGRTATIPQPSERVEHRLAARFAEHFQVMAVDHPDAAPATM